MQGSAAGAVQAATLHVYGAHSALLWHTSRGFPLSADAQPLQLPPRFPALPAAGTLGFEPLTLHRLDMNTTGVVLFAKKRDIVDGVHAQFRCGWRREGQAS